jgi:hypothetical protein
MGHTSSKSSLIAAFLAAEIAVAVLAVPLVRPAPFFAGCPPPSPKASLLGKPGSPLAYSPARPADVHAAGSIGRDIVRRSIHGWSRHAV